MPRKLGNPWHGGFIDGFDNQIFVNTVPIPTLHKWRRGRAEILDEGTVFIWRHIWLTKDTNNYGHFLAYHRPPPHLKKVTSFRDGP